MTTNVKTTHYLTKNGVKNLLERGKESVCVC